MQPDVLLLEGIGGGYTEATLQTRGLGGSEIEILQVARGLTNRGHSVAIANGVETLTVEDGITYVPHAQAWQHSPKKALYLQRWNTPETRMEIGSDVRIIVRANDACCRQYNVHQPYLSTGRAALVGNTRWQTESFVYAKERVVIPPMLEPMPVVSKEKGLFVFASGVDKGFEATVALWCDMKARYPVMRNARLEIVSPGWGEPRQPTAAEYAAGVRILGSPTPEIYRHILASAEGLFMVNTMVEVFGCVAALAERAGTRTHILCRNGHGLGGLLESVTDKSYITEDQGEFEQRFVYAFGTELPANTELADLTPSAVIPQWEQVLHLNGGAACSLKSFESLMPVDTTLAKNQEPLGPFFGDFLSLLRANIAPGGSEFGVGLMLFSLATSIKAHEIVEIGRFKGFSTLALAAACKLQDIGWNEPQGAEQRPDVLYHEQKPRPRVVSLDPSPTVEATTLIERAELSRYVAYQNIRSEAFTIAKPIDLLFIDGAHGAAAIRSDLQQYVPWVRPGGYFILHDYYGWFTGDGQNGSPIAQVISEELTTCDRVLIDTSYASLVLFRKATNLTEPWELPARLPQMPPRPDGRPTVGLCVIAKGDEVSTVVTRAIRSGQKAGVDCVTVVCDSQTDAADVARSLGADVVIRPTPAIDWANGYGVIAGARNDALAIAEQRTDYVLMLDADDALEGTLPAVLDRDAYEVTIEDASLKYARVQLFRSALGWRYRGIIHEVLEGVGQTGRLEGMTYRRGKSAYGHQDQDPPTVKFSKHAQLARKWLIDHPDDPRMQFYLARSLQDAGRAAEAIVAYETRIANRAGWDEERAYSAYQIGLMQQQMGSDPTVALLQAAAIGVPKAEPLVALARWYRDDARRQFGIAMMFAQQAAAIPEPTAAVFTQPWVYRYEAAAEVAICAYWLGRYTEARERFEALLPNVPADRQAWAKEQMSICVRDLARRS